MISGRHVIDIMFCFSLFFNFPVFFLQKQTVWNYYFYMMTKKLVHFFSAAILLPSKFVIKLHFEEIFAINLSNIIHNIFIIQQSCL
jgi:hypothetical protein